MFDWLRDLIKTDEVKRQEAITAYLDDVLTPNQRKRFEQQLAEDSRLQREVESQLVIKENLGRLPRVVAPRNFTLDPAKYGVPQRQMAPIYYPVLRAATAVAAIVFVLALVLDLFIINGASGSIQSSSQEEPAVAFDTGLADEETIEEVQEEAMEAAPREPEGIEAVAAAVTEEVALAAEAPVAEEVAESPSALTPMAMAEMEVEGEAEEEAPTGPAEEPAEEEAGVAAAQEMGSGDVESEIPEPVPTPTAAQPVPRAVTESATVSATPIAVPESGDQIDGESTVKPALTAVVAARVTDQPKNGPGPADEDGGILPADNGEATPETPAVAIRPIQVVEIMLGLGVILLATVTWLMRRRL